MKSISFHIEESILAHLKNSQFYSILADESSDISSKEELAICGRWLENGKVVELFLGIVHASEVNAKGLNEYLLSFLHNKKIYLSTKFVVWALKEQMLCQVKRVEYRSV